jgi:aspartokinase-like uncharacterized kinase
MEAVIKIGGSVAKQPKNLRRLCALLVPLAGKHKLLVVPGGGRFADIVREVDRTHKLSDTAAHYMAVLGTDQYGIMLSTALPTSRTVGNLREARELQKRGRLPILLPSKMIFHDDFLEHSWDVTSDSIAARIAGLAHAKKLILVKDVDGIFDSGPKKGRNAKIFRDLPLRMLRSLGQTCVDSFLPRVLRKHRLECYIVNGAHPTRIEAILDGVPTICTRIKP